MGKKRKKNEPRDQVLVVEDDLTLLETLEYNLRGGDVLTLDRSSFRQPIRANSAPNAQ
jgi:hypothetical protein